MISFARQFIFRGDQSENENIIEAAKEVIFSLACCRVGFPKMYSNSRHNRHENIGQE